MAGTTHGRLLTTEELATYTGIAVQTLEGWRVRGGGPRFLKISRRCVRYRQVDVDAWLSSKVASSTTEADVNKRRRDVR